MAGILPDRAGGVPRVGSVGAFLVTSLAFGLAYSRSRWRMGTMLLFAGVLGLLFLWSRSQWATVGAHLTVDLGTILWFVRRTYLAKN